MSRPAAKIAWFGNRREKHLPSGFRNARDWRRATVMIVGWIVCGGMTAVIGDTLFGDTGIAVFGSHEGQAQLQSERHRATRVRSRRPVI